MSAGLATTRQAETRPESDTVATALSQAFAVVLRCQLATGEMPAYFRGQQRGRTYSRSVLPSVLVSEALATFDPTSPWVRTESFDLLGAQHRKRVARGVVRVRRRIREFVRWQEDPKGTWRFHGRSSGLPADLDTTCSSAALLAEAPVRPLERPWDRHVEAIESLVERNPECLTRLRAAHCLRFYGLVGHETRRWTARLEAPAELEEPVDGPIAHPLALPYRLARSVRDGSLPATAPACELAVIQVLEHQDKNRGVGDLLSTSMALSALLGLGYAGPELSDGYGTIVAGLNALDSTVREDLFTSGGSSPACTVAFAMEALVLGASR